MHLFRVGLVVEPESALADGLRPRQWGFPWLSFTPLTGPLPGHLCPLNLHPFPPYPSWPWWSHYHFSSFAEMVSWLIAPHHQPPPTQFCGPLEFLSLQIRFCTSRLSLGFPRGPQGPRRALALVFMSVLLPRSPTFSLLSALLFPKAVAFGVRGTHSRDCLREFIGAQAENARSFTYIGFVIIK